VDISIAGEIANTQVGDACNPQLLSDVLLMNALDELCNEDDDFLQSYNEFLGVLGSQSNNTIVETPSWNDCPIIDCVYEQLKLSGNVYVCNTIDAIDNNEDFVLQLIVSDTDLDGVKHYANGITFYEETQNSTYIILDYDCDELSYGSSQTDLSIAITILHEMQHAKWIMDFLDVGLDPYDFDSFVEMWPAYESLLEDRFKAHCGDDFDCLHHMVMLEIENTIGDIAGALYDIFSDDSLTEDNFMFAAASGLWGFMNPLYENEFRDKYEGIRVTEDRIINALGCNPK
jgi:hypothetical protein